MKLNFKGFGESSLCDKCQVGQVVVSNQGERQVYCGAFFATATQRVLPNVMNCSKFQPAGQPNKYEMEKQAWILEVNKGKPVGFTPPKKDGV